MLVVNNIEQGSDEWHQARLGMITASRFKDVIAGGAGKTRKSYMLQLASEIITGKPTDTFTNEYMEWGTKTEPQARAAYELDTADDVFQVGFIKHNDLDSLCSPDGLVGSAGLVEFKCPKTTTQIETYLSGKMPTTHAAQVQGQLWIAEREWCDFVSFDPRINGDAHYFCARIFRDDAKIKSIETSVKKFQDELHKMVSILMNGNKAGAA